MHYADVYVQKREIGDISYLNKPIVITMPVYETFALNGNINKKIKKEQVGSIFVIIDWETNEVADWIFFEGNHGFGNWRSVECGGDPDYYVMVAEGSSLAGVLDKKNSELKVYPTGSRLSLMNYSTEKNYILLENYSYNSNYNKMCYAYFPFNVLTGEMKDKPIIIPSEYDSPIINPIADGDGNFWFLNLISRDNSKSYEIIKINVTDCSYSSLNNHIEMNFLEQENYYFYDLIYEHNNYLYINKYKLGAHSYSKSNALYKINSSTSEIIYEIKYPAEIEGLDCALYTMCIIENEEYVIFPYRKNGIRSLRIYKINELTGSMEFIKDIENFDMTETIWSREKRIYFMNSRNNSNVYYTYYDVENNIQGEVFNISLKNISSK